MFKFLLCKILKQKRLDSPIYTYKAESAFMHLLSLQEKSIIHAICDVNIKRKCLACLFIFYFYNQMEMECQSANKYQVKMCKKNTAK